MARFYHFAAILSKTFVVCSVMSSISLIIESLSGQRFIFSRRLFLFCSDFLHPGNALPPSDPARTLSDLVDKA